MGQFNDISIKKVISEINLSYFIPDIQRDYVWLKQVNDRKIETLFDSLLRGYPIGSFLFWKLKSSDIERKISNESSSEKLNFQLYKFVEDYDVRNPDNQKMDIDKVKSNDLVIVLDGQQRLTSLFIGLKGSRTTRRPYAKNEATAYETKKLYLNLKYHPKTEDPDDAYAFEFFTDFEVPKQDESNYWFKVGDVLSMSLDTPLDLVERHELTSDDAKLLLRLYHSICSKDLISYYAEEDKNLDKVLKIFIRVNSGGTILSYSDLLMSILTATFSTDIRGNMKSFVKQIEIEGFPGFERDHILKTCLILTGANHVFKLKNFSKTNIHNIESSWGLITDKISDAIKIVKDCGYAGLLVQNYVISIIAYYLKDKCLNYNSISQSPKEMNAIWQFIKIVQLKRYFTSGLDGKLTLIINEVKNCHSFDELVQNLANNLFLRITMDDIDWMMTLQYNNKAQILPVLQSLYPNLDYKNSTFHIDHIFPRSKFNVKNTQLDQQYLDVKDCLFNLQLLQGQENIIKKATDPETWLENHFDNDVDKIRSYKTNNYIDPDQTLEWSDFESFMNYRTNMIKDALIKAFIR